MSHPHFLGAIVHGRIFKRTAVGASIRGLVWVDALRRTRVRGESAVAIFKPHNGVAQIKTKCQESNRIGDNKHDL